MDHDDREHRVLPAGRGLIWFRQAIAMLERNARMLARIFCAYVAIEFVPNLLGSSQDLQAAVMALLFLLSPTLVAGLLHAIDEADAGRPVALSQLFEGLRRPGVRVQLLVLGLFVLTEVMLMGLSVQRILGPHNLQVLVDIANNKLAPDSAAAKAAAVPMLKALMVSAVIAFFLMTGLFFSIPRVMFDGAVGLLAIFESLSVCAANVLPLLVYGLVLAVATIGAFFGLVIVLATFSAIGPLGVLLFVPVLVTVMVVCLMVFYSGNYLAWREVFGHAGPSRLPPLGEIAV